MQFIRFFLALTGLWLATATAQADTYSFGVLSQRSAVLTAQYWNPILAYVQQKTGIELELKVTRTAPESNNAIERGEYDFVYSKSIFQPRMAAVNYQVILRPRDEVMTGQEVGLPVSVHPRVPKHIVMAVRTTIDGMDLDPAGMKILDASARAIGQKPPLGFRASSPADNQRYRK